MAGATRNLLIRNGRYYARLVVPKHLKGIIGRTELRTALGADRRSALKQLPGAIAKLQGQIARAERQISTSAGTPIPSGRYPLSAGQIATRHYMRRLAFDDECRQDHRYASFGFIDEIYVADLRAAIAGKLSDPQLRSLLGEHVEHYHQLGNHSGDFGSDEWRAIAPALATAELEALAWVAERDEGNFAGKPEHPLMSNTDLHVDQPVPISL